VEVATGAELPVTAPVDAFVKANPGLFPRQDAGGSLPPYSIETLLFYDRTDQAAGLLVYDPHGVPDGRCLYLHWDLAKGRITHALVLGRKAAGMKWINARAIGYSPTSREVYVQVHGDRGGGGRARYDVQVVAAGARLRTVVALAAQGPLSRGPFHDRARERAVLVEYGEAGVTGTPTGFLVDLRTGKTLRFTIPVTTYGLEFDPDGRSIYAFNAQQGELWVIDAATGARTRRVKAGTLGHGLGLVQPDVLLLLRNATLHFYDRATLVEQAALPTARFVKGFSHVEGSHVVPGGVVLRNGDALYLVTFAPVK
jgi:YVTN family beta-propeller protein